MDAFIVFRLLHGVFHFLFFDRFARPEVDQVAEHDLGAEDAGQRVILLVNLLLRFLSLLSSHFSL